MLFRSGILLIDISVPARGATRDQLRAADANVASIHAPARGATVTLHLLWLATICQPCFEHVTRPEHLLRFALYCFRINVVKSNNYKIEHLPDKVCALQVLARLSWRSSSHSHHISIIPLTMIAPFDLGEYCGVTLRLHCATRVCGGAYKKAHKRHFRLAYYKISVPCGSYEGLAPTCSTRFFQLAPKK